MRLLPVIDEEKRSIFFTILICAFLGISFVLFVVAYRNVKNENASLKEQLESEALNDSLVSASNQVNEVTKNESKLQSETNTIELSPQPTIILTPTPAVLPTATPTLIPTPIPFIVSTSLAIEPQNGDVCGTNFKFRGYITSSKAGTVTYRWKRTDAENVTMEPYPVVVFENAGTKEINYYLTLTKNTDAEGWFEIVSPESVPSQRARYIQQNC